MEDRMPRLQEPQDHRTTGADDAAAAAVSSGEESTDGQSESEFEFPLVGREHGSPAPADALFADGRIRPAAFYSVFGRHPGGAGGASMDDGLAPSPTERRTRGQLGRLFLEESRAWSSSSSSSTGSTASSASTSASSSAATTDGGDDGGLEGVAPESYCVWAPRPGASASSSQQPRKSGSTGSMARWRRISDLLVGRSHSDGTEKFLFRPANPHTPPSKPRPRPPNKAADIKKTALATEISTVAAAHRIAHYGAKSTSATPRRTFLPYREELVGFFANATSAGATRTPTDE